MGWYSLLTQLQRCTRASHDEADWLLLLVACECAPPALRDALTEHAHALRKQSHLAADAFLLGATLAHLPLGEGALVEECLYAWYATLCRDPRADQEDAPAHRALLSRLSKGHAEDWPYGIDDPQVGRRAQITALDALDELLAHLDDQAGLPWERVEALVAEAEERIVAVLVRSLEPLPLVEQALLLLRYWLRSLNAERWRGWGSSYTVNAAPPGANFHRIWTNARVTLARTLTSEEP